MLSVTTEQQIKAINKRWAGRRLEGNHAVPDDQARLQPSLADSCFNNNIGAQSGGAPTRSTVPVIIGV
jgi:hypothetical protein